MRSVIHTCGIRSWIGGLMILILFGCGGGGGNDGDESNQAPSAVISNPIIDGLTITLDASGSSDPDGHTLTYAWNFGDSQSESGVSVTHHYSNEAEYTITLTVSDGGLNDTASRTVSVSRPPDEPNQTPSAVIGSPVIDGLTITLDASGSSDPDGDTLTYAWNFGDGQSESGGSVTHQYSNEAEYTITLTVSDGELNDTASRTVSVSEPGENFPQPFDTGAVYLEEIFVAPAPTGNDGSGEGSTSAPFATIGHALSRASAGSRIRVQAGTYAAVGVVADIQGSDANPIAIVADGNVVIDAGGAGNGMQISNARYLVLQGLTFQNTGVHGLNIDDGGDYGTPTHHVVLRDLTFRDIGSGGNNDCLKMSGVDDFYITGCDIQECNQGEAIDMVGCHIGAITGNFIHDVVGNGVQTKGGSADVLIHGNRFEHIPERAINAGGSTGAPYFRPLDAAHEAAGIRMVANTFLRTGSAPVAFVGCDTCVFANNTIIEPQAYVARILEENTGLAAGHNGYFINNLLVFYVDDINSWSYVNVGPDTLPGSFTFGWNLWYALDDPAFSGPVYQGGVPSETHAVIQQNPMLADVDDGDYSIPLTSPARGRGTDLPGVAVADYDRAAFAAPPSLGAFEAQ